MQKQVGNLSYSDVIGSLVAANNDTFFLNYNI